MPNNAKKALDSALAERTAQAGKAEGEALAAKLATVDNLDALQAFRKALEQATAVDRTRRRELDKEAQRKEVDLRKQPGATK